MNKKVIIIIILVILIAMMPIVFKIREATIGRVVRVDGRLYYDTGKRKRVDCGVMDGEIRSKVPTWLIPIKDDQSNFSDELAYQFNGKKSLNVRHKGVYYIFNVKR